MKEELTIQENFLAEEDFAALRDVVTDEEFPWHYGPDLAFYNEEDSSPGLFTHMLYENKIPCSVFYHTFSPILKQLNVILLLRMRANLNPWSSAEPYKSDFHSDVGGDRLGNYNDQWTVSILYINTNNGYTELETGEKIESIANRLVSFSADTRHRIVTQTDTPRRMLINLHYLKSKNGLE